MLRSARHISVGIREVVMPMLTERQKAGSKKRISLMSHLFLLKFRLLPTLLLCLAVSPWVSAEAQSQNALDSFKLSLHPAAISIDSGMGTATLMVSFDQLVEGTVTVTFPGEDLEGGGKIFFMPAVLRFTRDATSQPVEVTASGIPSAISAATLTVRVSQDEESRTESHTLMFAHVPPRLYLPVLKQCDAQEEKVIRLSEGDSACLSVHARSLGIDQVWEVFISSDHPDDLVFSVSTVTLTAHHSSAAVSVQVRQDGIPEPEEEIRLAVRAKEAGRIVSTASLMFSVPGVFWTARMEENVVSEGTMTYLELDFSGLQDGEKLTGHIIVDSDHKQDVRVSTTVVTLTGSGRQEQEIKIFVLRDGKIEPPETVTFNVYIKGFGSTAVSLNVEGVTLSAVALPEQEGSTTTLQVKALNLLAEESLDVHITMDSAHAGDIRLSQDRFTLMGDGYHKIKVKVVADGVPETLEEIILTISAVDATLAIATTVNFVIEGVEWNIPVLNNPVSEGDEARLRLSAKGLSPGKEMEVRLSVDAAHAQDINLPATSVLLTNRTSSVVVKLPVLSDGIPEPREMVYLTATALNTTRIVVIEIPRNDYAVSDVLVEPSQLRTGAAVTVTVVLNATATAGVEVPYELMAPEGSALSTSEETLNILEGQKNGVIRFSSIEVPGIYRLSLQSENVRFTDVMSLEESDQDQRILTVIDGRDAVEFSVLGPVSLQAGLSEETVLEGNTALLTVHTENLLEGEYLEAHIAVASEHTEDVRLSASTVLLTTNTSSRTIQVQVLPDGQREEQETVELTVSAANIASVEPEILRLVIPHNGYAVESLTVQPPRVRSGSTAHLTVEVRLREVVATELEVSYEIRAPDDSRVHTDTLKIFKNRRAGSSSFEFQPVQGTGTYTVSLIQALFLAAEQKPGQLEGQNTGEFSVVGDVVLHLNIPGTRTVPEGTAVSLEIGAENLLPGQELEVNLEVVDPLYVTDLFLSEFKDLGLTTVTLTASTPQAELVMRAHADDLAEPREQVEVAASAPGAPNIMPDALSVFIPRNGYQVSTLRVVPGDVVQAGEAFEVLVELNAAAASTLEIIVRATTTGLSVQEQFTIPVGSTRGSVVFADDSALTEPAFYTVEVVAATFTQFIGGDQRSLLEEAPSPRTHLRVLPLTVPRLFAQLEEELLLEGAGTGERTVLTISAVNLPAHGVLEVDITVPGINSDDLSLSPESLSLEAGARTQTVTVQVINDDEPEPRETIEIRASAPRAIPGTAQLTIPRDDYAVLSMEMFVPQLRPGVEANLVVRLNAPPPTLVKIFGLHRPFRSFDDLLAWDIDPEEGVEPGNAGETSFILKAAGNYSIELDTAYFYESDPLSGDQVDLKIRQEPLEFQVLEEGSGLSLELSGTLQGEAAEGSMLRLQVSGIGLQSDGSLMVSIDIPSERAADLRFSTTTFQLNSVSSSRTVEVFVLRDGLPEPREPVQITITAPFGDLSLRQEVVFAIPRHGYAVERMQVTPEEVRVGSIVTVEVISNAKVPVEADLGVRWARVGSMNVMSGQELLLRIAAGERTARGTFTPATGLYTVFVSSATFTEIGHETGDQRVLSVASLRPNTVLVQDEVTFGLRLIDEEGRPVYVLQEGESAFMEIRANNLLTGQVMVVRIGAHEENVDDVVLTPDVVTLSANTPTQKVVLLVVDDDEPEPRETIIFEIYILSDTLSAPRSERALRTRRSVKQTGLSRLSVPVSHNDYALTALRISPLEVAPDEIFMIEAELNSSAPHAVLGRLLLSRISAGQENAISWPVEFRVARGQAVGIGRHVLSVSGVYDAIVDALWFTEDAAGAGEIAVRADVRALLRVGVNLEMEIALERQVVMEGASVLLTVGAVNLGFGEEAAVSLTVAEDYRQDVHFVPEEVQLSRLGGSASSLQGQIQIDVLRDGLSEPRETVPLILQGMPTRGTEVVLPAGHLVIPRNGYTISHFRVWGSAGRPSDQFFLEVELNGRVASTVHVTVQAFEQDTDTMSGRVELEIGRGAMMGNATMVLPTVSTHTLSISTASFSHGLPGDQKELLVDAMEVMVNVRALLDVGDSDNHAAAVASVLSQVRELLLYFEENEEVTAAPVFCTEEVRNALTVTGRLPCLDIDGDEATSLTDVILIQRYMDFLHLLAEGDIASSIIISGTVWESGSQQRTDRIIRNIQGLFPQPECQSLGLCY